MTAALTTIPSARGLGLSKRFLYPLRLDPIFQYRLWGGRRLANLLNARLPAGPVGEAWILSDRDDHASHVTNGAFKGQTIQELLKQFPEQMMGKLEEDFPRFPLLLKFLDARQMLSVQVHPSDTQTDLLPAGETGKTEAWVVLEAGPEGRICAGLKAGTTAEQLVAAISNNSVADHLRCLNPKPGDAVFIPAGTVHTLGDVVVFEVQQNSDVTFRLYDWDRVDAETGHRRALQVDEALASIDFGESAAGLVTPMLEATGYVRRERLFQCDLFHVWRLRGQSSFTVGAEDTPRILLCIDGSGQIVYGGVTHPVEKGNVFLLPAELGVCIFQPRGGVTLLEIAIPTPQSKRE